MCDRNVGIPFSTKDGNRPSSRFEEGEYGALLDLGHETRCSSLVGTSISGTFQSCIKDVKNPFTFQVGMWDFSRDPALEKGLISREENLVFFLKLWREA